MDTALVFLSEGEKMVAAAELREYRVVIWNDMVFGRLLRPIIWASNDEEALDQFLERFTNRWSLAGFCQQLFIRLPGGNTRPVAAKMPR
jgi:hypothetical protein